MMPNDILDRMFYDNTYHTFIFQFPIYLQPGVDRYLIDISNWGATGSKYIAHWKMRRSYKLLYNPIRWAPTRYKWSYIPL